MIKLKKIFTVGMMIAMVGGMISGCAAKAPKELVKVATLSGPTGIGMVKLIDEEKYETAIYQSPDEIVGKVINGEVDIACVPSNMAAILYNKTQGGVKLLATNTLGVLYIVENGSSIERIDDLKGKTILVSGAGSTPEYILKHVLGTSGLKWGEDVQVEYYTNHADVASKLIATEGSIALLPQPFVSTVTMKSEKVRVVIDLNEEWNSIEQKDLPMGTIIATTEFVDNNKKELEDFLKDYQASVEYVNTQVDEAAALVAKHGIVPSEEVAKVAIPKCNIVFRDAIESKETLEPFFGILSEYEPKSIGGKIPDEAFYYKNE